MAFKELYNLGRTPTFDITGREEITENLNLTAKRLADKECNRYGVG